MKVFMTADAAGGVWTYALSLTTALEARDVEVHLAVMGPSPADDELAAASERVASLHHRPFALEWMPEPWRDLGAAGEWLLEVRDDIRPDVVHLNGFAHAALDWRAPVMVVAHSDVLTWWEAVEGGAAPPEWERYAAVVTEGLAAADLVVAPTAALLEAVARTYRVAGPARVIPNGLDPAAFHSKNKEEFVLATGRLWDRAKNLDTAARAAAGISWPLIVAGPGAAPEGIRHLGVLTRSQMKDALARAPIFVLPALYEPFGLGPLEAAFSGCALVLGDIPSLREVWGDAAVFVDPRDEAALRDSLQALIDDPAELSARQSSAGARAQRFNAEAMAAAYLDAYAELLAEDRTLEEAAVL